MSMKDELLKLINELEDEQEFVIDGYEFGVNSESETLKFHKNEPDCKCLVCKSYFAVKEIAKDGIEGELYHSTKERFISHFDLTNADNKKLSRIKNSGEEAMRKFVVELASSISGYLGTVFTLDVLEKHFKK